MMLLGRTSSGKLAHLWCETTPIEPGVDADASVLSHCPGYGGVDDVWLGNRWRMVAGICGHQSRPMASPMMALDRSSRY